MSALATTAFRLCYSANNNPQQQSSLVALVGHAFQLVGTTVAQQQSPTTANNDYQTYAALSIALLCTLAAIPDTVLGSPGGARGRLSVDPRALQAAAHDLRRVNTAVLAEILQEQQQQHHAAASNGHSSTTTDLWILQTCARWVSFLPLTMPILQLAMPLLNLFLMQERGREREAAFPF